MKHCFSLLQVKNFGIKHSITIYTSFVHISFCLKLLYFFLSRFFQDSQGSSEKGEAIFNFSLPFPSASQTSLYIYILICVFALSHEYQSHVLIKAFKRQFHEIVKHTQTIRWGWHIKG